MRKSSSLCAVTTIATAVLAIGLSTAAEASFKDKMYLGGQLTRVEMNYEGSDYLLPTNSVDDKKWGGRLYAGYSFNDFWSAELGYNYFNKPEFKHNPTGNTQDMLQQGVDLVGKIRVPFSYGFEGYAKAGLLWVHRDTLEGRGNTFANKSSDSKFTGLGGLGLSYNFCPSWSADLSVAGTLKNGDLQNMYIYGLGLTYRFHNQDSLY